MPRYKINGIDLPSATEILGMLDKSSALMPWAARLEREACQTRTVAPDAPWAYKEVQEEALDNGSRVHDLIEQYIKRGKDAKLKYHDEVENAFLAFLDWEKVNEVEWMESEKPVWHPSELYAGTADALCKYQGKVYLIDFKSSKGFYSGYGKQVACYAKAREACGGTKADVKGPTGEYEVAWEPVDIVGCGVLRLDKLTGEPQFKDYTKVMERKAESFFKLLDFYYTDKKRRLKNNERVK